MMKVRIYGEIVEFYTYRSALVAHSFAIEDEDGSLDAMVRRYVERNNYNMDNHICWKTDRGLCYRYSDRKLFIGTEIISNLVI